MIPCYYCRWCHFGLLISAVANLMQSKDFKIGACNLCAKARELRCWLVLGLWLSDLDISLGLVHCFEMRTQGSNGGLENA